VVKSTWKKLAEYVAHMEEMRTMYINFSYKEDNIKMCMRGIVDFIILIKDGIHGQDLENVLMSLRLMRRW
jgi:hypothetical protein